MDKIFELKRNEWLEKYGFNAEGFTYIYFPSDSYDIKEQLKKDGFRFHQNLLWHCAATPSGYENKVIKISVNQVAEMSAWGEGLFKPEVRTIINEAIDAARPKKVSISEWIGLEGDKLNNYPVILKGRRTIETRFGLSTLLKFEDECGNLINWWTSTNVAAEIDSNLLLSGKIKKLDEYKGDKITIVTRCTLKEV